MNMVKNWRKCDGFSQKLAATGDFVKWMPFVYSPKIIFSVIVTDQGKSDWRKESRNVL